MPRGGTGNVERNVKGQVTRDGGGNKKGQNNDTLITKNSASIGPTSIPSATKEEKTNVPLGQRMGS